MANMSHSDGNVMFYACRMGKTTLLTHIASRKLAIPPNIDVLLCEQGDPLQHCVPKNILFLMRFYVLQLF